MKKFIFIIFIFLCSCNIVKGLSLPVEVSADAVVLLNLDENKIVYEKNPDKKEILASLTKMMTVYTAINVLDNLNEKVTIKFNDITNLWGYTVAGLVEGDRVTYLDLLYGTMLPSGADAAMAIANHISGSEEKFVSLMNEEAFKMGLRNTTFADCYGGSDQNISTARELSIFLNKALQNEIFKKVFSTTTYRMTNGLEVINYTRAVATFHGLNSDILTGNKSGFTAPAGLLLASTATINNTHYALIVCKSDINSDYSNNILETYKIYDYIETHTFKEHTIIPRGSIIKKINVKDGTISEYVIMAEDDIKEKLTDEEFNNIKIDYNIADEISPDNEIGDNLGYIDILVNDEIIDTYHFYLKDEIFSYHQQSQLVILVIIGLSFLVIILLCLNILGYRKK